MLVMLAFDGSWLSKGQGQRLKSHSTGNESITNSFEYKQNPLRAVYQRFANNSTFFY